MVDACAALGLDTQALLDAAGLSHAMLADADARIPVESSDALWIRAYEAANDPHLALHAAEALPFGAYKVLDFITCNAPTIGEGLTRVLHYFPIVDARGSLSITRQDNAFRITMASSAGPVPAPAQEYTFAALFLRSRASTNVDWPLDRVDFAVEAPPDTGEHERIFQCPVRFNRPRPELTISHDSWSLPVSGANAALFSVLDDHATRLLDEIATEQPPSLLHRVDAILQQELRGGDASAGHVAKQLGLGERTLQRRLREVDTTYVEVLARARKQMACEYLREPGVSLAEVAWLLGFAEQSSFTRAFKRWTGKPPGEWRTM